MCVISKTGEIVGIITRKNLMTYYLHENHVVTRIQANARRIIIQKRMRDGVYQAQFVKNQIAKASEETNSEEKGPVSQESRSTENGAPNSQKEVGEEGSDAKKE